MSAIATGFLESSQSAFLSFTTSMTDDHSLRSVSAGMSEFLKLRGGEARTIVWVWVSGASAAGHTEGMIYEQAGPSLGPMFDARERRRAGPGNAKHLFVVTS